MSVLKNKIVHCMTEEEANKLMQIAKDEGYKYFDYHSEQLKSYPGYIKHGITYFFDNPIEHAAIVSEYIIPDISYKNRVIEFTELFHSEQEQCIQETKITNSNTALGEKVLVKDQEDDDWQERYFLTVAHGLIYTTATEDGRYPFAWKYGIKKEEK